MSPAVDAARPITEGLFTDGPEGPRLVAGHCGACGQLHFPRGEICPYCAAGGCAPRPVGPAARLWLYTAVTSRPPGYRGPLPFGFGVVELAGGLRVVTRLTEARLEHLAPGLPMQLVLEPLHTDDDGHPVVSYAFRPAAP
jgi:uncharacterized OB-fold protein